jgi:hypothetical protein
MNTKSKSKKGIIGITLAIIMVTSIFAAMVTPVVAIEYNIGKSTLTGSGGTVDNTLKYERGDTVYYQLTFTPTSEACNITSAVDRFPDGSTEDLLAPATYLLLAQGETVTWETSWIIPLGWSSDNFTNYLEIEGLDATPSPFEATAPKTSYIEEVVIPPVFLFEFEGIGCLEVEFDGSASTDPDGSIVNHTWYYGDGGSDYVVGTPTTITHTYSTCGVKAVKLEGYDDEGNYNSTTDVIYVDCGPTASARATPTCFEGTGDLITFNGSLSHADLSNTAYPQTIVSYQWNFSDNETGDNDNTVETSRMVNDTVTATLTVVDSLGCEDIDIVTVGPCSLCNIRLYGTYGRGAGDFTVNDPYTGLAPENKPYSDPVAPFFPQHPQAPRKDFITFNPAMMDHNQGYEELNYIECGGVVVQTPAEKVFKRMWYEKEWFKDYVNNGEWDVVMVDGITTMTLSEWMAMDQWARPTIREWNSPDAPDWNQNADIYGPAIVQEFTYMTLNQNWYPIMVQSGSYLLIPMAHDPLNPYRGLNSFDADGDGERDPVRVMSENVLGMDIDEDGVDERMDMDSTEVNGTEQVVFVLENKRLDTTTKLQFFDHVVTLSSVDVANGNSWVWFRVEDNEGGGYARGTNFMLQPGQTETFYRATDGAFGERPVFYVRLISANDITQEATIEVGRMFGQTYANIEANQYRSQKAFIVDEVFYNVVAIKAQDDCFKYITFRQKLPKTPIKIFGKHLKVWTTDEVLPEMTPFNLDHEVIVDVWAIDPTAPPYPIKKIGPKEERPPLEIIYVDETVELRYKGELKEIYTESEAHEEF